MEGPALSDENNSVLAERLVSTVRGRMADASRRGVHYATHAAFYSSLGIPSRRLRAGGHRTGPHGRRMDFASISSSRPPKSSTASSRPGDRYDRHRFLPPGGDPQRRRTGGSLEPAEPGGHPRAGAGRRRYSRPGCGGQDGAHAGPHGPAGQRPGRRAPPRVGRQPFLQRGSPPRAGIARRRDDPRRPAWRARSSTPCRTRPT